MKGYIFLFCMLAFNFFVAGQESIDLSELIVTQSEVYNDETNVSPCKVVGNNAGGIIYLMQETRKMASISADFSLYRVEEDFTGVKSNKVCSEQIIHIDPPQKKMIADAFLLSNKLYVLFSSAVRRKKKSTLFYQEYDPVSLQPLSEVRILITREHEFSNTQVNWELLRSYNGENLVVRARHYSKKNKGNDIIYLWNFSADLELTDESTIDLGFSSNLSHIVNQLHSDENGKYYFFINHYLDSDTNKNSITNTKIYTVDFEKNDVQTSTLSRSRNGIVSKMGLGDGKIFLTGFIWNKESRSFSGAFYRVIDKESKIVIHDVSVPILDSYEAGVDFEPEELKESVLDQLGGSTTIKITPDGGAYIVSAKTIVPERRLIISGPFAAGLVGNRQSSGYVKNILLIRINPSGQLGWVRVIPHHQVSDIGAFTHVGYFASLVGNEIVFVYDDHYENIHNFSEEAKMCYMFPDRILRLVRFRKDGSVKDAELLSRSSRRRLVYTKDIFFDEMDKSFIVPVNERKKNRFVRIKF